MSAFNLNYAHKFRPRWAIFPGQFNLFANQTNAQGVVKSIGVDRREFVVQNGGVFSDPFQNTVVPYWDGLPVRVAHSNPASQSSGGRLSYTNNDLFFTDTSFTVVGIFKPIGNGSIGMTSDARVFSKDEGSGEADHDVMIGLERGTSTGFRCRVRVGSNTQTVVTSTLGDESPQSDAWNLVAAKVNPEGANTRVTVTGIRADGLAYGATATPAGVYNPRTTTDIALFGNAGVYQNLFPGDILCVAWFQKVLSEQELREFFRDPSTILYFQQMYVPLIPTVSEPVTPPESGGPEVLTITLVDEAGNPLTNMTGLTWAWYDENSPESLTTPPDTGSGATTDGSGIFSVSLPNTTLIAGQTGVLAIRDSTGYIYGFYRVTL